VYGNSGTAVRIRPEPVYGNLRNPHLEIAESTWHRWRNQYGGMKADDAKELRELRKENQRLKKIVADQALDIDMLKELNRGNW
jgi:hypothetical protein